MLSLDRHRGDNISLTLLLFPDFRIPTQKPKEGSCSVTELFMVVPREGVFHVGKEFFVLGGVA